MIAVVQSLQSSWRGAETVVLGGSCLFVLPVGLGGDGSIKIEPRKVFPVCNWPHFLLVISLALRELLYRLSPESSLNSISDGWSEHIRPPTNCLGGDADLLSGALDRTAKKLDGFRFLHAHIKACFLSASKHAFCNMGLSMKDFFHANVR